MNSSTIQLIECPRDAMQGWEHPIPTNLKAEYINALLIAGFHTIDFGSFVSPKAIPQMADTTAVLKQLDKTASRSALLAIVANERGAEEAVAFDSIDYLGYPFSVSPTFQNRNTNAGIDESWDRVNRIQEICIRKKRKLVIYLSMAFGNPYGDEWNEEIVFAWAERMQAIGVPVVSLADTVGLASPEQVGKMTGHLIQHLKHTIVGVHLHSRPDNWREKLEAAWQAGCTRFDGALRGIGGCPMANDQLVGNIDTLNMIHYFDELKQHLLIDRAQLQHCLDISTKVFV